MYYGESKSRYSLPGGLTPSHIEPLPYMSPRGTTNPSQRSDGLPSPLTRVAPSMVSPTASSYAGELLHSQLHAENERLRMAMERKESEIEMLRAEATRQRREAVLVQENERAAEKSKFEVRNEMHSEMRNEMNNVVARLRAVSTLEELDASRAELLRVRHELSTLKTVSDQQTALTADWRKKYDSLFETTKELERNLEAHKGQVSVLTSENRTLGVELAHVKGENKRVIEQSEVLSRDLWSTQSDVVRLKQQCERHLSEIAAVQASLEKERGKTAEATEVESMWQRKSEGWVAERVALKKELDEKIVSKETKIAALEREILQWKTKYTEESTTLASLRKEIDSLRSQKTSAEEFLEGQNSEWRTKWDTLTMKLALSRKEVESVKEESALALAKLEDEVSRLSSSNSTMSLHYNTVLQQYSGTKKALETLTAERDTADREADSQRRKAEQLAHNIVSLRKDLESAQSDKAQSVSILEAEASDWRKKCETLTLQLASVRRDLESVRVEESNLKATMAEETTESRKKIDNAAGAHMALRREMDALRSEKQSVVSALEVEIDHAKLRHESLSSTIAALRKEIETLKRDLAIERSKVSALENDLLETSSRHEQSQAAVKKDAESLRRERTNLEEEVAKWGIKYETSTFEGKRRAEEAQLLIVSLQKQLDSVKRDLADITAAHKEELADCTKRLESATLTSGTLKKDLHVLQVQNSNLSARLEDATLRAEGHMNGAAGLRKEVNDIRGQHSAALSDLHDELAAMKYSSETLSAANAALKKELLIATEKYSDLQAFQADTASWKKKHDALYVSFSAMKSDMEAATAEQTAQLQSVEFEAISWKKRHETLAAAHEGLKRESAKAESEAANEVLRIHTETASWKKKHDALYETHSVLKSELDASTVEQTAQLQSAQAEAQSWRRKYETAHAAGLTARAEFESQISDTTKALHSAEADVVALRKKYEAAIASANNLKRDLENSQSESANTADALQAEISEWRKKHNILTSANAALKKELDSVHPALAALEMENKALQKVLERHLGTIGTLEHEVSTLKAAHVSVEAKVKDSEREVVLHLATVAALRKELDECRTNSVSIKDSLEAKVSDLKSKWEDTHDSMTTVQKELEQWKRVGLEAARLIKSDVISSPKTTSPQLAKDAIRQAYDELLHRAQSLEELESKVVSLTQSLASARKEVTTLQASKAVLVGAMADTAAALSVHGDVAPHELSFHAIRLMDAQRADLDKSRTALMECAKVVGFKPLKGAPPSDISHGVSNMWAEAQREIDSLRRKFMDTEVEINANVAALQAEADLRSGAEKDLSIARTKIGKQNVTITELEAELASVREQLVGAHAETQRLHESIALGKSETDALKEQGVSARAKLQKQSVTITTLEAEVASVREQMEAAVASLENQVEHDKLKKDKLKKKLEKDIEDLSKSMAATENERDVLLADKRAYEEIIDDLKKLNATLQSRNAATDSMLESCKAEATDLKTHVTQLQERLSMTEESSAASNRRLESELCSSRQQAQEKDMLLQAMKLDIEKVRSEKARFISNAEIDSETAKVEIAALRADVEQKRIQIKGLENEINENRLDKALPHPPWIGFEVTNSAVVLNVIEGGPAYEAGVLEGDRCLRVGRVRVDTLEEFRAAVRAHVHAGDIVPFTLQRKGKVHPIVANIYVRCISMKFEGKGGL